MAASGTDLFRKKANNFSTTLSAGILAADTSAPLTAVTGLPTDTAVDLVIDRVDTNGNQTPTKREYVKGIVSGSTIASLTRGLGNSTALAHATGAVVEMVDTSDTHNDLVTALLNVHNQVDGSLKAGSVTSTALGSGSVTSGAIAASAVGTAQLAQGAVAGANIAPSALTLGYTQITSSFTTSLQAATQVTGLSVTVTVPAGGRSVKITAFTGAATNTSNSVSIVTIWDGAVGSGTQIGQGNANGATNSNHACTAMAVVTPTAGTKTYNVGFHVTGFTSTFGAAATSPAFILVEAI